MERYEIIAKSRMARQLIGCPILLLYSVLTYDYENNELLGQLKFQNLGNESVNEVVVDIWCGDNEDEYLTVIEEITYFGHSWKKNDQFGMDKIISIPNQQTRNIQVKCKKILMEDGLVWINNDDSFFFNLQEAKLLEQYMDEKSYHMLQQKLFGVGIREQSIYLPFENNEVRLCPCGAYLAANEKVCSKCGKSLEWWNQFVSKEQIIRYQLEKEQVQRIREEEERQRAALASQKAAKIKLAKIVGIPILLLVCFALLVSMIHQNIIVPEGYYKRGMISMKEEEYEEAKDLFEKSGKYKDSDKKREQAEELLKVKGMYDLGKSLVESKNYYDAAYYFYNVLSYKDAKELYNNALYAGIQTDVQNGAVSDTTLQALQILDEQKYKSNKLAYYYGKYYYIREDYSNAIDKWQHLKNKEDYVGFDDEYERAKNLFNYEEALGMINVDAKTAYENLEKLTYEVEESEKLKTLLKEAFDSGFLGKWKLIDASKGKLSKDVTIKIDVTYKKGEFKYRFKVIGSKLKESYYVREGEGLREESIYVSKFFMTKEGNNIRRARIPDGGGAEEYYVYELIE